MLKAVTIKNTNPEGLATMLEEAVSDNRLAATRLLLKNRADPNCGTLWRTAVFKGYASILRLLIEYGLDLATNGKQAMLTAVSSGRSECIETLHRAGVPVDFDMNLPLARSVEKGHVNPTKTLLTLGADPNARDGRIFATACEKGSFPLIYTMVLLGADPSAQPVFLDLAMRRRNISIVTFLVNNGAELDAGRYKHVDGVTLAFLKDMLTRTWKTRLQAGVHTSFQRHDFKWQPLAVPASLTVTGMARLKRQAKLCGVDAVGKNKREICRDLALACYPSPTRRPNNDSMDLSGTDLTRLPTWQVIELNGKFWNVFDLFKLQDVNKLFDPYTYERIPSQPVDEVRRKLSLTLTTSRFRDLDILEAVRNNPVPCRKSILRDKLSDEVWDKLPYPPSMDVVLEADNARLDDMLTKLSLLTSGSSAYPMITPRAFSRIRMQSNDEKIASFVALLAQVLELDDELSTTRAQLLTIVLRNASDHDGAEEDLFSFITEEPSGDFHFDVYDDF